MEVIFPCVGSLRSWLCVLNNRESYVEQEKMYDKSVSIMFKTS